MMSEKVLPVKGMGQLMYKQGGSLDYLTERNPAVLNPDILNPSKHSL